MQGGYLIGETRAMTRLKDYYLADVKNKLQEDYHFRNPFQVPKLTKIVINMGLAEAKDNEGVLEKASLNLASITGQKPVVTRARKSISAFKLTKGAPIGLMVTVRGEKMYTFLDKLINIVLPKVRDFRGVSVNSFDKQGNFNLGLREQLIFPEIDYKNVDKMRGLQITINTTAQDSEQARRLLELLGMPFQKGASV